MYIYIILSYIYYTSFPYRCRAVVQRLTSRSFKWLSSTSVNHLRLTGSARNVDTTLRRSPTTDWSFMSATISLHSSGRFLSAYRLTYVLPSLDSTCKLESTHFSTASEPTLNTCPWYSVYSGDSNSTVSISEQLLSTHL